MFKLEMWTKLSSLLIFRLMKIQTECHCNSSFNKNLQSFRFIKITPSLGNISEFSRKTANSPFF